MIYIAQIAQSLYHVIFQSPEQVRPACNIPLSPPNVAIFSPRWMIFMLRTWKTSLVIWLRIFLCCLGTVGYVFLQYSPFLGGCLIIFSHADGRAEPYFLQTDCPDSECVRPLAAEAEGARVFLDELDRASDGIHHSSTPHRRRICGSVKYIHRPRGLPRVIADHLGFHHQSDCESASIGGAHPCHPGPCAEGDAQVGV